MTERNAKKSDTKKPQENKFYLGKLPNELMYPLVLGGAYLREAPTVRTDA